MYWTDRIITRLETSSLTGFFARVSSHCMLLAWTSRQLLELAGVWVCRQPVWCSRETDTNLYRSIGFILLWTSVYTVASSWRGSLLMHPEGVMKVEAMGWSFLLSDCRVFRSNNTISQASTDTSGKPLKAKLGWPMVRGWESAKMIWMQYLPTSAPIKPLSFFVYSRLLKTSVARSHTWIANTRVLLFDGIEYFKFVYQTNSSNYW